MGVPGGVGAYLEYNWSRRITSVSTRWSSAYLMGVGSGAYLVGVPCGVGAYIVGVTGRVGAYQKVVPGEIGAYLVGLTV